MTLDSPNPCASNTPPLAEIDGTTYQYLAGVFAVGPDGTLRPYCAVDAWPDSPAGQTAERRLRMDALRIELARLEAEEARWTQPAAPERAAVAIEMATVVEAEPPVVAAELPAPVVEATPAPAEPVVCPRCGHRALTAHGLSIHLAACRGETDAVCPHCDRSFATAHGLRIHLSACYAKGRPAEPAAAAPDPEPPSAPPPVMASDEAIRAKQRVLTDQAELRSAWRCASCGSAAFATARDDETICVRCARGLYRDNGHTAERMAS